MGILVLFIGLLPYLSGISFLNFLLVIPIEGPIYQGIIIAIGAIMFYTGIKK
tara:strand:+ start:1715 stop:1870 length:156 start_codon:yes stop_codon:yes gene_type:complete